MKYQYTYLLFMSTLIAANLWGKNCTEGDIRSALNSGKSFDYTSEGCSNLDGVITIKKGIAVNKSGWTFDGRGKAKLVWKGGGKCDKASRSADFAFFGINANNVTLRSFTADSAPEGIHVTTGKNNILDDLLFVEVCEKAIRNGNKASNAATGTLVRNSEFRVNKGPADHTILVQGGSIRIEKNLFKGRSNAIAACAENPDPGYHGIVPCKVPSKITAVGNELDGCGRYGMRSAGKGAAKGGYLIADGNTFKNCKTPLMVEEEGHVEARNNNFMGSCDQGLKTTTSKATGLYGCGNSNKCKNKTSGSGIKFETSCN